MTSFDVEEGSAVCVSLLRAYAGPWLLTGPIL
jgi:hypothetical protein